MRFIWVAILLALALPRQALGLVFAQHPRDHKSLSADERSATYFLNNSRIDFFSGSTPSSLAVLESNFKSLFPERHFFGASHRGFLLGCLIPPATAGQSPEQIPFECLWATQGKTGCKYHRAQFEKLPNLEIDKPLVFAEVPLPIGKDHPTLTFSDPEHQSLSWLHIEKGSRPDLDREIAASLRAHGWNPLETEGVRGSENLSYFRKAEEILFLQNTKETVLLLHQKAAR